MEFKRIFLVIIILFISFASAKEESRPMSKGGDYIAEFNLGIVSEEAEDVFEMGLDLERFIDGTDHHFSIGITTEFEFKNPNDELYLGPLFSLYYHHVKTFISSGFLTDLKGDNRWKSRIGVGYEFIIAHHYIIIPTAAVDYVADEFNPAIALGLAHEF